MSPRLIVICGPTATGKSDVALTLAEKLGSPILSADSRQVYRGFDIGTAKPSLAERSRVPHYLIDLCSPRETLTLGQYQQQAQHLIGELHQQGQIPLLVGGSGLYIRAIIQGLHIPPVPPHPDLRTQLQRQSQALCYQWLQQVDPVSAAKIHAHDQVRTLRALEVYYVTGIPLSQQQGGCPPPYPILQIGLDFADVAQHTQHLQQRTDTMVAQGWIDEVSQLINRYGPDLPLLNTLGYREMKQHLTGVLSLADAKALTVTRTRQFAKRQRTWFRSDRAIVWFDSIAPHLFHQIWETTSQFLDPTPQFSK